MAKLWDHITKPMEKFINTQKLFYIASVCGDDELNLSPKGVATLRVIDKTTVIYADYSGSGNQTAKHLSAGGKATLLLNSFGEKPLIVRLYCKGRVVAKGSVEFNEIVSKHYQSFDPASFRQVFVFDVYKTQTSCGYGVPVMEFVSDRSEKSYFEELHGK